MAVEARRSWPGLGGESNGAADTRCPASIPPAGEEKATRPSERARRRGSVLPATAQSTRRLPARVSVVAVWGEKSERGGVARGERGQQADAPGGGYKPAATLQAKAWTKWAAWEAPMSCLGLQVEEDCIFAVCPLDYFLEFQLSPFLQFLYMFSAVFLHQTNSKLVEIMHKILIYQDAPLV